MPTAYHDQVVVSMPTVAQAKRGGLPSAAQPHPRGPAACRHGPRVGLHECIEINATRANSGLELACMLPRRVTPNRAYQSNLVRCMPRRVTPLITQILSSNGFRDNVHIALPHYESKGYHEGTTIFLSTLIVLFELRIRPNKTRSHLDLERK